MKGSEAWALVSRCPGPWPGFPVTSWSQLARLGWAQSLSFLGWGSHPGPPGLSVPHLLRLLLPRPFFHPPAASQDFASLTSESPFPSLGLSLTTWTIGGALRCWATPSGSFANTPSCSSCFRVWPGLPLLACQFQGLGLYISSFISHSTYHKAGCTQRENE